MALTAATAQLQPMALEGVLNLEKVSILFLEIKHWLIGMNFCF